MACSPALPPDDGSRMCRAPELVRERLLRATQAIQDAGINYAVIGANAVAFWVGAKDEGAIRNTPNVDVLIHPSTSVATRAALESVGFVLAEGNTRPISFLDGPEGKLRQAVRIWLSGDIISPTAEPLPSLVHSLPTWPRRVIALPVLVRMKLSAWRTIDRVHLQDLAGVGQLNATWLENLTFPEELAERLRHILANPDG
jgi:hypothetical protein